MLWSVVARLVAVVAALVAARGVAAGCGVAQFACRSGECVRLDAYCDGNAQCGDASDEPPHCSPCNRTYYGRAGVAYEISVKDPARAPFLCHLTFTAGGGAHGDLIQLAFEEFRVGRYQPAGLDGCPDGYMQLSELGRPFTGGSWCGHANGTSLYYSETATVTVSVKLFRARLGEAFALRLRYKFLAQRDAVVRFGTSSSPLERGAVSPGTYCTRTYEECHRASCRLQSPNYPGMYPRNVTCYWSLRQRLVPACKHAMISVRQDHAHKMQIKRSISMASLNKTGRAVRAWRQCTGERDRLLVYDGASTDDPVLLEYCGGDWLPRVTARGPAMLVAFHSSPYSAPPRPASPNAPLRGFELDVDVVFADSDSLDYARETRHCEFHVKASSSEEEMLAMVAVAPGGGVSAAAAPASTRGRRGKLTTPRHTLPPNTTCTWTFHGRPGDLVWVYFSSYTHYSLVEPRRSDSEEEVPIPPRGAPPPRDLRLPPASPTVACGVELRIASGGGSEPGTLLGRYCDAAPALCARAALANATRHPRPCAPPDGYVSGAALLSLAATTRHGTATHPLGFALHYEFVDARLEGVTMPGRGAVPVECARLLERGGALVSPRNALWFGRGGARRLRCVWRLEGGGGARLTLHAAVFGAEPRCRTLLDTRTGYTRCSQDALDPAEFAGVSVELGEMEDPDDFPLIVPHLKIFEAPWAGYRVAVGCICDNSSTPVSAWSGAALELELVARRLSPREDHRHLQFRGEWTPQPRPAACAQRRRLPAPGQHLFLVYPYSDNTESECGSTPFLMSARGNNSVFLRVWGHEVSPDAAPSDASPPCHTTNRLLVYDAHSARLVAAICPSPDAVAGSEDAHYVQVWSLERGGGSGAGAAAGRHAFLVVWAAREAGRARVAWMQVWRSGGAACERACGALQACMPPALWCDGRVDCPDGRDEAAARCGAGARLLAALAAPGAGAAAGALLAAAALLCGATVALLRLRKRRNDKQLLGADARRLTEEALCAASSRASSVAS